MNIIKTWSVNYGACIAEFKGHTEVISSININQNGKLIVSGSGDKTIRIWNNAKSK